MSQTQAIRNAAREAARRMLGETCLNFSVDDRAHVQSAGGTYFVEAWIEVGPDDLEDQPLVVAE